MTPPAPQLFHFSWLFGALTLALLPHVTRFSPAMIVCFVALGSWRLLAYLRIVPLPDRQHRLLAALKLLLAISACLAVWISYRGQPGRDAGVALLTVLVGLKLVEFNSARDYYVVSALGYFLIVTNFLYSQSIPLTGYLLFVVLILTAGLVAGNAGHHQRSPRWCAQRAAILIAQAIPIALAAFIFFPRVDGPLWGRPLQAADAVSGLSDEMAPGSINELSLSDEIAFRVNFTGAIPPPPERYWRGPVLWDTDGRVWRKGSAGTAPPPKLEFSGPAYSYTITLEPNDKRWLLALEHPAELGPDMFRTSDLQVLSRFPLRRRTSYSLVSRTHHVVTGISSAERDRALALPPQAHPLARALAARWRRAAGDDAGRIVDTALAYFNREPFAYTLTPPLLTGDSVDEFLFQSRAGFCEHYAGSFVTLMRAAGVPARVVTGYQGGELNPVGDYLIVRQRDAHAWTEVWIENRGWLRVDPTAAVAPERVSLGFETAMPSVAGLPLIRDLVATVALWRSLRNNWDAVNHRWNQWVLGYNPVRQRQLLDNIGLRGISAGVLGGLMLACIGVLFAVLALAAARSRSDPRDPVVNLWRRYCRKLARAGLRKAPHEGPLALLGRVAQARADLHAAARRITHEYIRLRYGRTAGNPRVLQQLVRSFNPRPRKSRGA